MIEIIAILQVANAIEYIFIMIKIGHKMYSYVEISNKLGYVEDMQTIYEIGEKLSKKNNNKNTMYKMGRLKKVLMTIAHNYSVSSYERDERRYDKRIVFLAKERKLKKKEEDLKNELKLYELGYLKDVLSKHFVSPIVMLERIRDALLLKGVDEALVDSLIRARHVDETPFDVIKEHLYYLEILDTVSNRPFECTLLEGVPVWSPESILYLQDRAGKLVYVNTAVIEHENLIQH